MSTLARCRGALINVHIALAAIAIAFLASCATEPDGSAARRTGGPSLDECLQANGIYLVQLDRGGERMVVEEVWRHDPNLGETPAPGSELRRPGQPRAIGGTRIPDHFIVFEFNPPIDRPGHGFTPMSNASVFDGYVPVFDLSVNRLRRLVQTTPHEPPQPIHLQPVGDTEGTVVHRRGAVAAIPGRVSARLLHSEPPVYPLDLRRNGIGGEVLVDALVLADGTVTDVRIARATDVRFGEAAVEAVKRWTYAPATQDGVPIQTRLQVPIVFTLNHR